MILPGSFSLRYSRILPVEPAVELAFIGDALLLQESGELPETAQLRWLPPPTAEFVVGDWAGQACVARFWPGEMPTPAGMLLKGLRSLWGRFPDALYAAASRARQLLTWELQSRYCGACGTPTQALPAEPGRECPACRLRSYPRISPVAMVLVQRPGELLLARSPHFQPGLYSALAGFVEAGESLEDCARREVREEVGVEVDQLRWFGSQSWPFPHSLMLAFHARYQSGDVQPQPGEIEDARWFPLDALPLLPHPHTLAWQLIQDALRSANQG